MTSPLAKGLFQKSIAESGGMFGKQFMQRKNLQETEKNGKAVNR